MLFLNSAARCFTRLTPALAIIVLGTQLGSSCASSDSSRYPTDDRSDRFPGGYDDEYTDRIPDDARLIREGTGDIGFRAASNGRMWLYDVRDRDVLYWVDLLDGDDVRVSPEDDRVYINGRSVKKMSIAGDRPHRIYFDGRRAYVGRDTPRREDDRDRPSRDTGRDRDDIKRPVPDTARVVAESRGGDLSFKLPDDGRVYLYDNSNNALVQVFNLKKGQRLTVSPSNDLVTLDGKTVMSSRGLSRRAEYRLLYQDR